MLLYINQSRSQIWFSLKRTNNSAKFQDKTGASFNLDQNTKTPLLKDSRVPLRAPAVKRHLQFLVNQTTVGGAQVLQPFLLHHSSLFSHIVLPSHNFEFQFHPTLAPQMAAFEQKNFRPSPTLHRPYPRKQMKIYLIYYSK